MFKHLIAALGLMSCTQYPTQSERIKTRNIALEKALEKVQGQKIELTLTEKGIANFKDFYADFSPQNIQSKLEGLYDKDSFFKDGIKSVQGEKELREYFLRSVENVYSCKFHITDISMKDSRVYFLWEMHLETKKGKGPWVFTGMSHVIFTPEGKVLFHEDFWDFSELLQEVPALGSLIQYVKSRF